MFVLLAGAGTGAGETADTAVSFRRPCIFNGKERQIRPLGWRKDLLLGFLTRERIKKGEKKGESETGLLAYSNRFEIARPRCRDTTKLAPSHFTNIALHEI